MVLVVSIERVAAQLFGIITYGVQLLAYREGPSGLKVWIARRARTKRTFPGMLDSTVGGSLRHKETPAQCLVRESGEEASIPASMVQTRAKPCGSVTYLDEADSTVLTPETQFMFEMEVDQHFIPVPNDGEVEQFVLMTINELKAAWPKDRFLPPTDMSFPPFSSVMASAMR